MPNKKEKIWMMGNKGPTGPWVWHAWVKGSKKPVRVVAFDIDHISCQLEGKQVIKAKKLPEEKDKFSSMPLGPKGSGVNRPADYDTGFKILTPISATLIETTVDTPNTINLINIFL